jgi:hypothetical protein
MALKVREAGETTNEASANRCLHQLCLARSLLSSFIFFSLDLWSLARQELPLSTRQAELAKVELFNIKEYREGTIIGYLTPCV